MSSILTLWSRRELHSSQRSQRPRSVRRSSWKLKLELLEDRTLLSSWSTAAPMLTARLDLAAATGSNGQIYAIGGTDGLNPFKTVEAYNTSANTWSTVASLSIGRSGLAAATGSDGKIYAIGGLNHTDNTNINTV